MAWTDLTFSFGSILTATKMTQLDDNFEALANADSGAPTIVNAALATIQEGKLGSGSCDRTALKEANATTFTGTLTSNTGVNMALTNYALFPMIHVQSTGRADVHVTGHGTDGANSSAPRMALYNTSGSQSFTYDVDHRYVAA